MGGPKRVGPCLTMAGAVPWLRWSFGMTGKRDTCIHNAPWFNNNALHHHPKPKVDRNRAAIKPLAWDEMHFRPGRILNLNQTGSSFPPPWGAHGRTAISPPSSRPYAGIRRTKPRPASNNATPRHCGLPAAVHSIVRTMQPPPSACVEHQRESISLAPWFPRASSRRVRSANCRASE